MIGNLPENVKDALLETIPIEFSVLSADDKVLGWNKHDTRIFKRPEGVVGRDVRNCHPPKSLDKVLTIIALRDKSGKYLGCLEASQDITEIQKLSGEKRILDA